VKVDNRRNFAQLKSRADNKICIWFDCLKNWNRGRVGQSP